MSDTTTFPFPISGLTIEEAPLRCKTDYVYGNRTFNVEESRTLITLANPPTEQEFSILENSGWAATNNPLVWASPWVEGKNWGRASPNPRELPALRHPQTIKDAVADALKRFPETLESDSRRGTKKQKFDWNWHELIDGIKRIPIGEEIDFIAPARVMDKGIRISQSELRPLLDWIACGTSEEGFVPPIYTLPDGDLAVYFDEDEGEDEGPYRGPVLAFLKALADSKDCPGQTLLKTS